MELSFSFPISSVFHITTLLSLIILALTVINSIINLSIWIIDGFGISFSVMVIFCIASVIIDAVMCMKARKWSKISKRWAELEKVFRKKPYEEPTENYKNMFTRLTGTTTIVFIALSLVYHLWLYSLSKTNLEVCENPLNISIIENMYVRGRYHLFIFTEFKIWMAPILSFHFIILDLCWGYSRNFVVLCIIWIVSRFKQLHKRIITELEEKNNIDWTEIYKHFRILVALVEDVDKELGFIILFTCAARLPFLCYFLFKISR